jgi:hypothetical protein
VVEGYIPGAYGIHIGIPSYMSNYNTHAIIAAELAVSNYTSTATNTTIYISSVNAPAIDLTVRLFGLEVG